MITFFVPGIPVPKGSAKAFYIKKLNRAIVTQDNAKKQKPWASIISVMGQQACLRPTSGPVAVELRFFFPRPKGHYGSGKNALMVKGSAPCRHLTKPDLDKLVRCVLDALTGVAWMDDSQVVDITAVKSFGDPGCMIAIDQMMEANQ